MAPEASLFLLVKDLIPDFKIFLFSFFFPHIFFVWYETILNKQLDIFSFFICDFFIRKVNIKK